MINELQGTLKKKNSTVKCMVINSSAQKIYRMYVTVKKHLTFPWLPQCISETEIICTVIVQHQTNQRNKNIRWPGMNKGYISAQQVGKLYVGPIFFLNKGLSSHYSMDQDLPGMISTSINSWHFRYLLTTSLENTVNTTRYLKMFSSNWSAE